MRVLLTIDDLEEQCRQLIQSGDMGAGDVTLCHVPDQSRVIINAVGGAEFQAPDGETTKIAPDNLAEGDDHLVVGVTVTPEDRAGTHLLVYGKEVEAPEVTSQQVVDVYLRNAMTSKQHRIRSLVKWETQELRRSLPPEEGYIETKVFDMTGKSHLLRVPGGPNGQPKVTTPVEGDTHYCPTSPTHTCWYDDHKDPEWNICLFCGDPYE